MKLTFRRITEFNRGILYRLLLDAYSFDDRYRKCFEPDWIEFDNFFFDNPEIAEKYGFMTVLDEEPIGHISWDPRNQPNYVAIGHNCIATQYKGNGYGKRQLSEALRRIKEYENLKKIIVQTNSKLVAPHNYESVGFQLVKREKNESKSAFSGDYLDYEIFFRK
ncbi:MAG: GNAT family N-acetyltransferase [bacterium]|nr:GNAT family N-acetyltransferase [bacterium]